MIPKIPYHPWWRLMAGALLLLVLFTVANFFLSLNWFGPYPKQVMTAGFVLLFLFQVLFGPSIEEVRTFRTRKNGVTSAREAHGSPLVKWGLPYAITSAALAWQFYGDLQKPNPDYVSPAFISLAIFVILFFVIKKQSQRVDNE